MKLFRIIAVTVIVAGLLFRAQPAQAVGEAGTKVGVFVPSGTNAGRPAALIVTAITDNTSVDIIDDGTDGDTDDSHTGLVMNAGQSFITYLNQGTINDDVGGKADGDYFWVKSSKPVLVHNLTLQTDWQHDFVPADNHRMSGTSFYVYTPNFITVNTSGAPEVIDLFAYNDNTDVQILDITLTAKTTSGLTTVKKDSAVTPLYTNSLNAGQDLIEAKSVVWTLTAGHTYHILANKNITVIFGAIGKNRSTSRDGGDYVPGKNGFSTDKTFYFTIPYNIPSERELRLVSYSKPADVTVRGWNTITKAWDKIGTYALPVYGHADLVGNAAGTYNGGASGYYLYEVTADNDISVFEANWMETGSFGTSDMATYISSEDGTGAGNYFLAYMGPPGTDAKGVQASHVVVSANAASNIHLYDPDSYGEYVELYNPTNAAVDLSGWKLTNKAGWTLTIPAGKSIAAKGTFLLEFHEKATDPAANYVYGVDFPKFKIDNGAENLVLANPAGSYTDTLAYTDTGWGLHGVYHSLERKNANLPFTAGNAQDGSVVHGKTTSNLGDYWGTPGVINTTETAGNGSGSVIINEVMSGRLYQTKTMSADSYYIYDVNVTDWTALNNGETPPSYSGNPEKPYIVVESDKPVTVMASNWNDNWMTYATGTIAPDPDVHSSANVYQGPAGSTVTITTYVEDKAVTLNNPTTTIELPSTVQYNNGSFSTPTQIAAVTPSETHNADGTTTISWSHDKPLPPGDVYRFDVSGTIKAGTATDTLVQVVTKISGTDTITNATFASQDSNVVTVGAPGTPVEPTSSNITVLQTAGSDLVINEVNIAPACIEQSIELHNKSTMLIDLTNYELSNENGFIYRFPTGTFITNDGYLVVHLSNGTNNATNLYTTQAFGGALSTSEDQIALYKSSTHSTTTLVDFVQWGTNNTLVDPTQQNLAVSAGQWAVNTMIAAPASGQSIGRDRYGMDSNTAADWTNTGGKDSNHATIGSVNVAIPGADITPPSVVTTLNVTPVLGQQGTVAVNWSNPPEGDLAGVKIIRSFDTYPSRFSDEVPVYSGMAATFSESNLPPGQPVYYTAFAYDDKGNVACPVSTSKGRAIVPQRQYMAYEDLKGSGWVDWDTNDMIFIEDSAVALDLNGVKQISITFNSIARGSWYSHTLNLSMHIAGSSTAKVDRYNASNVLLSSSTSSYNNFVNLVVFDNTTVNQPASSSGDGFTSNTVRGSTRAAGYKTVITITVANSALNPTTTADIPPFDPYIHVTNTGANIHLMQAGSIGNTQTVMNSASPLYGRDIPLGLSFNTLWKWPKEGTAIWDAYAGYASFLTSGGTQNPTWFLSPTASNIWVDNTGSTYFPKLKPDAALLSLQSPPRAVPCSGQFAGCAANWPQPTGSSIFASPLITDVNGDGKQEIVVASQDGVINVLDQDGASIAGWPNTTYNSTIRSTPAVGDIDGDGNNEVVVGGGNYLWAWHADGSQVSGFPQFLDPGYNIFSTPVLAELDNTHAGLEIVVATGGMKVFALTGAGATLPGWPVQMGGQVEEYGNLILNATPAVGDLTGDGIPEIVAGSTDGKIYAWNLDGTLLNHTWPQSTQDWIYASPLIVDLNGDGYRDVVAASGDGRLYAWRGDGFPLPGFPYQVRGAIVASPAVVDIDGDGHLEVIFTTLLGKVYVVRDDGTLQPGWPRDMAATSYSSPVVGDIDGNGDLDVLVGSHSGLVYAWHANGIPVVDWPKVTGDWVVSSPALGDLNGDGLTEVAATSYDGNLYVWDTLGLPTDIPWASFRAGPTHDGLVATSAPINLLPTIHSMYIPGVQN
jgi:LruC domain-containing protein